MRKWQEYRYKLRSFSYLEGGVGSLFSGYTFHFVVSYLMRMTFFDAAFGVWVVIFIEVVAMLLFGNRSFLGRLDTSEFVITYFAGFASSNTFVGNRIVVRFFGRAIVFFGGSKKIAIRIAIRVAIRVAIRDASYWHDPVGACKLF